MAGDNAQYLSVTQLTTLINSSLESEYPKMCFAGEISEVNLWSSGHLYVTLKDPASQVNAVMWRSSVGSLRFKPKAGDVVNCIGRPNLYHKTGRFQMVVTSMQPAGEGMLQRKFLELKEKLEKEGLFDPTRKRALPFLPRVIGVVTSGQGAVIHDIMVRIRERMPNLVVYLADAKVQGPGAAHEIADGVRQLNQHGEVEVIIVARGGGSLEDLWAFNEEVVVRAIFASRVPVISGVGHEVDVTLADLVADVRAPTPTAAAEMVVPKRAELLLRIEELERRLCDTDRWFQPLGQALDESAARLSQRMSGVVEEARLALSASEAKLRSIHPLKIVAALQARVESQRARLLNAKFQIVAQASKSLELKAGALQRAFPLQRIHMLQERVQRCRERLSFSMEKSIQRQGHKLDALGEKLRAVDPRRVLERGFAVVEVGGRVVRTTDQLTLGEVIKVSFAQGAVKAAVTGKV